MQKKIARLKKRRDELLSRACNRQEHPEIMEEVRRITRKIQTLKGRRQKS